MGSIHEVMEAFRGAPSNSERGTTIEKVTVRYFDMDPLLSQQYGAAADRLAGTKRQARRRNQQPGRACRIEDGTTP